MRALVVDDEALARERIVTLLSEHGRVEVVGECADGLQAVADIARLTPDVVFLDVQMPGLDGFEVVDALGDATPVIVFVTAYDEHALRAFEVNAIDYLLKPIERERFQEALRRVVQRVGSGERPTAPAPGERVEPPRRVVGKRGTGYVVVPHDEIRFVEAAGNYLRVHSTEGEALVRSTLKALQDRLDRTSFLRVHRSTLVNLAHVRGITALGHGEYELAMSDGERLRCSRAHAEALRRALGL